MTRERRRVWKTERLGLCQEIRREEKLTDARQISIIIMTIYLFCIQMLLKQSAELSPRRRRPAATPLDTQVVHVGGSTEGLLTNWQRVNSGNGSR